MNVFDKLLALIREGVAVQSILALLIMCAIVYQVLVLREPPAEPLVQFAVLILGFFFGSKSSADTHAQVKALLIGDDDE